MSNFLIRFAGQAISIGRNVLTLVGLLLLVVLFSPMVRWWNESICVPWDSNRGEILVVLAGSSMGNGILGENSYWRSVFAVQEYRANPYRRVIVSGSSGEPESIALSMKRFLESHGIPGSQIEVEDQSLSTRENAHFTARRLVGEKGKVVLVSSDYHMYRAVKLFTQAGLSVIPRPYPDVEKRYPHFERRWGAMIDLATETVKIVYYYAHGWI